MTLYQLVVYGYKRNGEMCPICSELLDNYDEADFRGQSVCDVLSSSTGIYACYGYNVDELHTNMVPKEV